MPESCIFQDRVFAGRSKKIQEEVWKSKQTEFRQQLMYLERTAASQMDLERLPSVKQPLIELGVVTSTLEVQSIVKYTNNANRKDCCALYDKNGSKLAWALQAFADYVICEGSIPKDTIVFTRESGDHFENMLKSGEKIFVAERAFHSQGGSINSAHGELIRTCRNRSKCSKTRSSSFHHSQESEESKTNDLIRRLAEMSIKTSSLGKRRSPPISRHK